VAEVGEDEEYQRCGTRRVVHCKICILYITMNLRNLSQNETTSDEASLLGGLLLGLLWLAEDTMA
jgi:hypothetical protein